MGLSDLVLEPFWDKLQIGDPVNVQCYLIVYDPCGVKHLCRSVISQKLFTVEGTFNSTPLVTFLQATVTRAGPRTHLDVSKGYVLNHATPGPDMYQDV